MKKEKLLNALNVGIIVNCKSKNEQFDFLKELKGVGGKWIDRSEIVLPPSPNDLENVFHYHVNKDLILGKVSAMCYHVGGFASIDYEKLQ